MKTSNSIASLGDYLDNHLDYPEENRFAAIIGERPSQGARSPTLWNAAFKSLKISAQMLPMDITSEKLGCVLEKLSSNPLFIGGAIAVPHKEAVAEWLGDSLTMEAKAIGSVNCLFRNHAGELMGTNTDGEAARKALVDEIGEIEGKSILVLGGGGAGKAVAAYMASGVGSKGKTFLACRNRFPTKEREKLLGIECTLRWNDFTSILSEIDILVNCTTLGGVGKENDSPLSDYQLELLPAKTVVYDIIYNPNPTRLLASAKARGLTVFDGLRMNLEQAVIAFGYAVTEQLKRPSLDFIRTSMASE